MIESETECIEVGTLIDYPFRGSISSPERPSGCFWDQNGNSYLNDIFQKYHFRLGPKDVGGICKNNGKTATCYVN